MTRIRKHARGFADPLIYLFAVLPLSLAELAVDSFNALRAAQADAYDYEAEARRIAVEPFDGDEQEIAAAEAAWRELDAAAQLHFEVLDRFKDPETGEGWFDAHYDYYALIGYEELLAEINEMYADEGAARIEEEIRRLDLHRTWAQEALNALDETGITEHLRRAAGAERSILGTSHHLAIIPTAVSTGTGHRSLWRGLDAAKRHARHNADWEAYVEYHRLSLALSRHWMQQMESLAWLPGLAMRAGSANDLRDQLTLGQIPPPVILELQRVEREQEARRDIHHVLAGLHVRTLEALDAYFCEGGVAVIDEPGRLWNILAIALPRRATAERVVDRYFAEMGEYARLSRADRAQAVHQPDRSFVDIDSVVRFYISMPIHSVMGTASISRTLVEIKERHELEQLALELLMAIELYRAEHGTVPATLADLVPAFLDEVPTDPFDPEGLPLRYRALDQPDESGRTYILYSVGRDGADNDAHLGEVDSPIRALQDRYPGTDYVINHVEGR